MAEPWTQLLASTVVAAIVSSATIIARELLVARAGRRAAAVQAQQNRARNHIDQHEMLLREIDSLWRHNAQLRRRESACQSRCRTLERRLGSVERTCNQLRMRLEGLVRAATPEPNLQQGN